MEPHNSTPRLKLVSGPTDRSATTSQDSTNQQDAASLASSPLLPVAVRDLVPLLVDAFQTDRTWLKDFGREHIHVSADLYEILLAYQQYRRCDAA